MSSTTAKQPQKKKRKTADSLKRYCIVKPSSIHGMGVFSTKKLEAGDVVEQCYTLKMPWKDAKGNVLGNYCFDYKSGTVSLILGNGMIYNHSSDPNLEHEWMDEGETCVQFKATKPIKRGQELFIDYGEDYWTDSEEKPI
jgi:SET domain-containing protein